MATVRLDPALLFLKLVFMVFCSYKCGQFKQEFHPVTNVFKILCVTRCVYVHFCNCACYLLVSSVVPAVGDSLVKPCLTPFLVVPISLIFALQPYRLSFSGRWLTDVR